MHRHYGLAGGGGKHHHRRHFHHLPFPVMYPPQYQEPSTVIVNAGSCPTVNDPVLASDGRVYPNACEANLAGHRVVRHLPASSLRGIDNFLGPHTAPVLFGVGLVFFLLLKKRG